MKPKSKMNTKPQAEINTVLYAVAHQPKLSTDAIALEGAGVSRGNGIGATLIRTCKKCGNSNESLLGRRKICDTCKKKYSHNWYIDNKKQTIERSKIWAIKNRQKRLNSQKKSRDKHRAQYSKTCSECGSKFITGYKDRIKTCSKKCSFIRTRRLNLEYAKTKKGLEIRRNYNIHHPDALREAKRKRVKYLYDGYVRDRFIKINGFKPTHEQIEQKRLQLKITRKIKQIKNEKK